MQNIGLHSRKTKIVDHDPESAGFLALRGYYQETPWRDILADQHQASLSLPKSDGADLRALAS